MAKNKNKDVTFNSIVRALTELTVKLRLTHASKSINEEDILPLSNILKEWYNELEGEFVLDYINYIDFCELIDYTSDLFIVLKNSSKEDFYKNLKLIRNKLADSLIKKGFKMEYFISVNRICFLFDNISSRPEYRIFSKVEPITAIMFLLAMNVSTYLCRFENKEIKGFKEVGSNILPKYNKNQVLSEIEIQNANTCYINKSINEMILKSTSNLMDSINKAYEIFMHKDLSEEFSYNGKSDYSLTNTYIESPFLRNETATISMDFIKKIPNDRLFISPKGGIKYEIINKNHNIDSLELIEEDDRFYFNVYFINNGEIGVVDSAKDVADIMVNPELNKEFRKYDKKILKTSYLLYKSVFNHENWSIGSVMRDLKSIGCRLLSSPAVLESVAYTLLCCIYLAFYDPFMLKTDIRMYNMVKDKKGGYKRTEGFRIAHLRKLPQGYHSSKEAIAEAKKAGFTNIPEGYTFVSASNVNLQTTKKKKIIIE